MSDAGTGSRSNGWTAVVRTIWQHLADRLAVLGLDAPPARLEGTVPVVTIDVGDETVLLRRFEGAGGIEIARLPRAQFTPAALRAALSVELGRMWYLRDAFALRLPESWALKRTLALPLAARRNLKNLLDFELDRQSPLDRGEVYHDHLILRIDPPSRTMDVIWRIVRRKNVDELVQICREAGIELAVVALTSDEAPTTGGTFPVSLRASRLLRARQWTVPALVLAVAVLVVAIVAGVYLRNQQANDALLAKVAETRIAASFALRLEHRIIETRERVATLVAEKHRATVTAMLAEVTQLLPDGTWLTDFSYSDDEVRLQGYSGKASALIAIFDASPQFAGAEFRAPLVQAQDRNTEQFDLALKLRRPAK